MAICEKKITHKNNIIETINDLQNRNYIAFDLADNCRKLIKTLFEMKLEVQCKAKCANSSIKLYGFKEFILQLKENVEDIYNTLTEISKIAKQHLNTNNYIPAKCVSDVNKPQKSIAYGL